MRIISGSILLFSVLIGGWVGYDGTGNYELEIPSCTSDELQQLGDGTMDFCDKSIMMKESIDIPDALNIFLDIEVNANWDEPNAWIGIVKSDQAEKCTEIDEYLVCDTAELDFFAGGPDSNGSIDWEIEEAEYHFVAGSSVETSGSTTDVEYSYALHFTSPVIWTLVGFGAIMILTGLQD